AFVKAGLVHTVRSALGDGADVRGLQALRPLLHLEFDLLPFGQRAEAVRLDGGVMAEDVRAAVVLHDEPEPLRVIEPFHGTCNHSNASFDVWTAPCRPVRNHVRIRECNIRRGRSHPESPPALPPAIQAGAIPPKVTGFAVQTPAVVPGDGIPWWDKDGLRSERAGKRHPAPSAVAPRSSRVRRPGAGSARVRALAAACRAALVADAAGRAARVRQLAVQRALLVRGEPAAHQPRAPGRGRSSLPRRALGRAALSPRTRGLRGDALLADAAVAQCLRRARQADGRSSALRSLLRRERRLAGGLRALRRDQAIP